MSRTAGGPDLGFTVHSIIKSDTFGEFVQGDKVTVAEPRFAGMVFDFVAHCTNVESGAQWVDLWGGARRHEYLHAVKPENLRKKVDIRRSHR